MSASYDDILIADFINVLNHDAQLKRDFAAALRIKDRAGLRQAISWVVDNLIKPAGRALRDRAVQNILNAVSRALGALP